MPDLWPRGCDGLHECRPPARRREGCTRGCRGPPGHCTRKRRGGPSLARRRERSSSAQRGRLRVAGRGGRTGHSAGDRAAPGRKGSAQACTRGCRGPTGQCTCKRRGGPSLARRRERSSSMQRGRLRVAGRGGRTGHRAGDRAAPGRKGGAQACTRGCRGPTGQCTCKRRGGPSLARRRERSSSMQRGRLRVAGRGGRTGHRAGHRAAPGRKGGAQARRGCIRGSRCGGRPSKGVREQGQGEGREALEPSRWCRAGGDAERLSSSRSARQRGQRGLSRTCHGRSRGRSRGRGSGRGVTG